MYIIGFCLFTAIALSCPLPPQLLCFSTQIVPPLLSCLTWTHKPLSSFMNISNYRPITQFKFSKSMSAQHLGQHLPRAPTWPLHYLYLLSVIAAKAREHPLLPILTLLFKKGADFENSYSLTAPETTGWSLPWSYISDAAELGLPKVFLRSLFSVLLRPTSPGCRCKSYSFLLIIYLFLIPSSLLAYIWDEVLPKSSTWLALNFSLGSSCLRIPCVRMANVCHSVWLWSSWSTTIVVINLYSSRPPIFFDFLRC